MLSPSQQFLRRTVSTQCHRHSMSRRSAYAHRRADNVTLHSAQMYRFRSLRELLRGLLSGMSL